MRQVANFTIEILKINEVTNRIYQQIKDEIQDNSLYSKEQTQQVDEDPELPEDIFELLTKKEIKDFNNLAKTEFEIWATKGEGMEEQDEQDEETQQEEQTPVEYNDYSQGHSEGYTKGYYAGYDEGYEDGNKDKEMEGEEEQ